MKRILIPAIAIFLMASCNEKSNQELSQSTTQKTEVMQKKKKNKKLKNY